MRRRLAATAALATLSFAALGTTPAPAAAPAPASADASVEVMWTVIVARGAAVDVSYSYTCPAGVTARSTATLTQVRADGLTARGTDVADVACTGGGFLEMQRITAGIAGAPFERGPATLSLRMTGCDGTDCFDVRVDQKTRIKALP